MLSLLRADHWVRPYVRTNTRPTTVGQRTTDTAAARPADPRSTRYLPIPLLLQSGPLLRKHFRQPLHGRCHQTIRLLHRFARLIHEPGLNLFPARSEIPATLRTGIAACCHLVSLAFGPAHGDGLRSRISCAFAGRLPCARSAVVISSFSSNCGSSFLNGCRHLYAPFLLRFVLRPSSSWNNDAIVDHRLPQVFGAGLACGVSQGNLVSQRGSYQR